MNFSSRRYQSPVMAPSKVRSIGELCENLGFKDALPEDYNELKKSTRVWMRAYIPTIDLTATDLLRWNEAEVQKEFRAMAEGFLASKVNERRITRFWGVYRTWKCDYPHFPEHREIIIGLLMQLFWNQNKYTLIDFEDDDEGHDMRSSDEMTPVENIFPSSKSPMRVSVSNTEKLAPAPAQSAKGSKKLQSPKLSRQNSNKLPMTIDIYDVPDEEDGSIQDAVNFLAQGDETGDNPRLDSLSDDTLSSKRKRYSNQSPRRSGRKRVRPQKPGFITNEDLEDHLRDNEDDEDDEDDANASIEHNKTIKISIERDSDVETMPPVLPSERTKGSLGATRKPYTAATPPMTFSQPLKIPMATPKKSPLQEPTPPNSNIPKKRRSNTETYAREVPHAPSTILGFNLPSTDVNCDVPEVPRYRSPPLSPLSSDENDALHHRRPSDSEDSQDNPTRERSNSQVQSPGSYDETGSPGLSAKSTTAGQTKSDSRSRFVSSITASSSGALNQNPDVPFQTEKVRRVFYDRSPQPYSLIPKDWMASDKSIEDHSTKVTASASEPNERMPKSPVSVQPAPQSPSLQQQTKPESPSPLTQLESSSTKRAHPRPKTQVPLWIITHTPRYTEELWSSGRFTGTSLSTFLAGISEVTNRTPIEKIKLTLRTPMSDTKITVLDRAEEDWVSAREVFVEKLRETRGCLKREVGVGGTKILIEPIYAVADADREENEGEGEEEFDF